MGQDLYCLFYDLSQYTLLLSFTFFFASFATSFFTPIFLSIAVYIVGNASQGIYDYVTKESANFNLIIKSVVSFVYYVFPNFSVFDYTVYASYSLPFEEGMIAHTFVYFVIYLALVMVGSIFIFNKRDFY